MESHLRLRSGQALAQKAAQGWDTQLLAFLGFAHDRQGVLAAVYRVALVGIILCGNVSLGIRGTRLEVCIAAFTNAEDRRRGYFYDPQFALRHDCSLAHRAGRT